VPDAHLLCCSACGNSFTLLTNRRHHCRCCGGLFCGDCSNRSTSLLGWGYELPVRVCEECERFETRQLPMLLAGDVWTKRSDWGGLARLRYVHLTADQANLVWSPWRDDEGADAAAEKTVRMSQVTCVSKLTDRSGLAIQAGSELIVIEGADGQTTSWVQALQRLVAINQQRHSFEALYGDSHGTQAPSALPRLNGLLVRRQQGLLREQQRALLVASVTPNGGRSARAGGGGGETPDALQPADSQPARGARGGVGGWAVGIASEVAGLASMAGAWWMGPESDDEPDDILLPARAPINGHSEFDATPRRSQPSELTTRMRQKYGFRA